MFTWSSRDVHVELSGCSRELSGKFIVSTLTNRKVGEGVGEEKSEELCCVTRFP